jgi:hypothetical protein
MPCKLKTICLRWAPGGPLRSHANGAKQNHKSRLPFLGVDGPPRTGQAWVRHGILAATVIVPPTTSEALDAFGWRDLGQGPQAERTLVAPKSFPEPAELAAKSTT